MSDAIIFSGSIADYHRWHDPLYHARFTPSMEATMSQNVRPVDIIAEHNCGHVPPCTEHLHDADALLGKLSARGWNMVDRDQAEAPPEVATTMSQKIADRAKVDGILGQPAAALDTTAKLYDDLAPENITKPVDKAVPAERTDTLQQ